MHQDRDLKHYLMTSRSINRFGNATIKVWDDVVYAHVCRRRKTKLDGMREEKEDGGVELRKDENRGRVAMWR